jgi:hypothetical protein
MIYSVYQGDIINVTDCIFMNSSSTTFHSHGSTGGSIIVARKCYFKDVGNFDCTPDDDALIYLIDCEFSNSSISTFGSVSISNARLNITKDVVIAPAVVDRECLWYVATTTTVPTASPNATDTGQGMSVGVATAIGIGSVLGAIFVVIVIVLIVQRIEDRPKEKAFDRYTS